jgi:hypothetical protein
MSTTTGALWTYTYLRPGARHTTTLDCFAANADAALRSAQRFIARENRRLRAAGFKKLIRRPTALQMINETAAAEARAAAQAGSR